MKIGCIGELVVDFICPTPVDSIAEAVVFEKHPGGSPANVAVACGEAGVDVLLMSKVGKGSFGQFVRQALVGAGCSTAGIQVDLHHPTRCVFMSHNTTGTRSVAIANRLSADQFLRLDEIDGGDAPFDVLHIGGTTMLGAETAATTLALATAVKQAGGLISYDPNINLKRVAPAARARTERLLGLVDLLKVNDTEWEIVASMLPPNHQLLLLVHTRGADGATLITAKERLHLDPPAVVPLDVTGAGDAFYGGVLGYLASHATFSDLDLEVLKKAGEAGRLLAAEVIQHMGGLLALRSRS